MKKISWGIAAAGLAALLVGCASKGGAKNEPTAGTAATADTSGAMGPRTNGPPHMHGRMGMGENICPMAVPGTTMTEQDAEGGAALVFTTKGGDVDELRKRVRSMAEMHNAHHASGGPAMSAGMGRGMGMGTCPAMPASTASAEDIEGGARLVLKATDASQADALRQNLTTCSQRTASGECPMMMMMREENSPQKPPPGH